MDVRGQLLLRGEVSMVFDFGLDLMTLYGMWGFWVFRAWVFGVWDRFMGKLLGGPFWGWKEGWTGGWMDG